MKPHSFLLGLSGAGALLLFGCSADPGDGSGGGGSGGTDGSGGSLVGSGGVAACD